jgi:4-hydroxybenzoate polyprenyltransferase
MKKTIHSGRFYFWPIIAANMFAMTLGIGGDLTRALAFSVVISCLASFGFLLNDLWDRKIDGVNRAGHFEDARFSTVSIGVVAALGFLLSGIVLAFLLGRLELRLAVGIALALMSYSLFLRKVLLLPTVLAAVLAASPLWTPLVLWARTFDQSKWAVVVAIVLMVAGREILMDSRDQRGDLVGGRQTMPTVFGARIAKMAAVMLSVSAGILLVTTVVSRALLIPLQATVGAAIVTSTILYLVLPAALRTLSNETREAIQYYVIRSRIAMALTPLLLLFWRP